MAYTDRLREARKRKGLSQAELAGYLGVGPSTLSGYETGFREPSMEVLNKLMHILEVDANYIFQDEMEGVRTSLPPDEQQLLDGYRQLEQENKALLLKMTHYLIDSEEMEVIKRKVIEWDARQ